MSWFKLDDGWASHPKVQAASKDARLAWIAIGLHCARHATDGFVTRKEAELCANSIGTRPKLALDSLETVGLLDPVDGGYQIHNWSRYQPSRADVVAAREARRAAAREANHRRWHVGRNVVDPTCTHCGQPQSTDQTTDVPEGQSTDRSRESPVPSRPYIDRSSLDTSGTREHVETENDQPKANLNAAAAIEARRRLGLRAQPPHHPAAWLAATERDIMTTHATELGAVLAAHPAWTAEQIAATVLLPAEMRTTSADASPALAAVSRDRSCPECRGTRWAIDDETGDAVACGTCNTGRTR